MVRGLTTGGVMPSGMVSIAAAILLWTRTAAWSGSVPTRKRTMISVPDGCEME